MIEDSSEKLSRKWLLFAEGMTAMVEREGGVKARGQW